MGGAGVAALWIGGHAWGCDRKDLSGAWDVPIVSIRRAARTVLWEAWAIYVIFPSIGGCGDVTENEGQADSGLGG